MQAFHDLCDRRRHLERTAYAAIAKEDEAARTFHNATRAAHLHTRLHHSARAHHACEHAMARDDPRDRLLQLLRDVFHRCAPCGRLRTVAGVRAALTLRLSLIEESDAAVLPKRLPSLRSPLDDSVAPCAQAESMQAARRTLLPQQTFEALVRAWHHAQLSSQSPAKHKRYHPHESQQGLDCAAGLLAHQCAPLHAVVFETLDALVHASSLVELVKACIRPSLKSPQGHMTQETFKLLMFSQNHRRDTSGKRQGKAPIALLTGEA